METLKVIDSVAEVEALAAYLADKDLIAVDSETTGLDRDCEIVGMSFCAEDTLAYYAVTAYWDPIEKCLIRNTETTEALKKLLRSILGKS